MLSSLAFLLPPLRIIAANAWPVLVAQLASMAMMVIDTALLGHYGAADLAAVAVGGGIYIAVVMAAIGVLQAVAPVVAHLHGAGREAELAGALQQAFWLALFLAVPACLLMRFPGPLLALTSMEPVVEAKTRDYLGILAWGLPFVLIYRSFHAFSNALGQPRPLMVISLLATSLHLPLSWALIFGHLGSRPLGVAGSGYSTLAVSLLGFACALGYLLLSPVLRPLRLLTHWQRPRWRSQAELLRLGLPMGFSNLVEISAFTFIALFVAGLGATVVAGHRIIANLSALAYMLPLSVAIATLAQVGRHAGAQDWLGARAAVAAGMLLAGGLSSLAALGLWFGAGMLVPAYSSDPEVVAVALSLIGYLAAYQLFDAIQTIAGFALRACKVTLVPMVIHTLCFWGVGLGIGWWLAFGTPAMGAAGYWLAATLSLVPAAALLSGLLWWVLRGLAAEGDSGRVPR
ncbi:MAG TPA: MATE family efflux transporter [Azospira sp.]|nr:MATE family efflux transporter [Azospira sp.]